MFKYLIISLILGLPIYAQVNVEVRTQDKLGSMVSNAVISFSNAINQKRFVEKTDNNGNAYFKLEKKSYHLNIVHEGYSSISRTVDVKKDTTFTFNLKRKVIQLQDIVVTAKEKDAITSTSLIDKRAIEHLQPSSFSDLLSLLPGNNVLPPLLNQSNHIKLREVGIANDDYSTSSLGTSFLIDGLPINTNANMQETVGGDMLINPNSGYVNAKRNSTRKGVDMRKINTDNIEKVEIVRGIPSVKYGDLSSGLVKIIRKKGASDWSSRFKADGYSKLFSVGKGTDITPNFSINFDIDFLNAQNDPRNDFENFKRYTASVRGQKKINGKNTLVWDFSIDYTGTLEEEKTNPDIEFNKYNSYNSSFRNIRVGNQVSVDFNDFLIDDLHISSNISQSFDELKQSKWVQLSNALGIPINTEPGEHYGIFVEPNYISHQLIDGKPMDVYLDLYAQKSYRIYKMKNKLLGGVNWMYSKNFGLGQIYDIKHPPSPEMSIRPRAFKDIPSMQTLAYYIENTMQLKYFNTKFNVNLGLRGTTLLGLDNRYSMQGKIYIDPRLNLKITFPEVEFTNGKHLDFSITTGWGKNSKMPTQNMIYPQDIYWDFMQLNYFHNKKEYRQLHYYTEIVPQINYHIQPAINVKKEIGLEIKYDYYKLNIAFFNEKMTSGFRRMSDYRSVVYKKYNASHLNHQNIQGPPLVENLPYEKVKVLILSNKESNGSSIHKKGLEFQYSGKRWNYINTKFTINGAWFQTEYRNSLPVYRFPKKMILNDKKHYNLGLYEDEDIYFREMFNTAFTADTYIPYLELTTSFRIDFNWYLHKKQLPQNGTPTHYIDNNGVKHTYGEKEKNDYVLQWLNVHYNPNLYDLDKTPFYANAHIKISKNFYKYFTLSMYVNRLFNVYSDYYVKGIKIEQRGYSSPYFGMEMNVKL